MANQSTPPKTTPNDNASPQLESNELLDASRSTSLSQSMLEEVATVIAYDETGWVTVEIELKSACNHCSNNENCGTSTVSKAFSIKRQQFSLKSDKACEVGDLLKLALPESVILKAALLVYIFPLIGLFIGALIGLWFSHLLLINPDYSSIVMGALGGIGAWLLGKRQASKLEAESTPVITAYLGQGVSLQRS